MGALRRWRPALESPTERRSSPLTTMSSLPSAGVGIGGVQVFASNDVIGGVDGEVAVVVARDREQPPLFKRLEAPRAALRIEPASESTNAAPNMLQSRHPSSRKSEKSLAPVYHAVIGRTLRENGPIWGPRNKKPGGEVANPHAGFLNINLVSWPSLRSTIQFPSVQDSPHNCHSPK